MKITAKGLSFAVLYGLAGGLVLTFLFKWMEAVTGKAVYTFLLNVDYIPVVQKIAFPEWIEVLFHLIVSIAIAIGFYVMYQLRPHWKKRAIIICLAVSVVIGMALYPTTALSERTPEWTDSVALVYWLAGHAIFGIVVGWFFQLETTNVKQHGSLV